MTMQPWYRRARRWCQTNLTENDGRDCDVAFWRAFWKKNGIQGILVNAGGTVGYFPSDNPYQYRAKFLGGRDLLREFVDAAREAGLAVMARMDINQAAEELFKAKPDWFMRDANGNPIKMGARYITCINGPYYTEFVPGVMREIIEKYRPEAFSDNSWTGSNTFICHCENCKRKFKEAIGMELPDAADYGDRAYRLWIQWSMRRRTEVYEFFNAVASEMGGDDCLWMGMLHPEFYPAKATHILHDEAQLTKYNKAYIVDHQSREEVNGFEQNSINGMMLHQVLGENALIIQCTASYSKGKYFIRKTACPPEEMRSWMISGISAGLTPSPHFIGSVQEDRRIFDNCAPIEKFLRENEQYLFDRELVSNAGLLWSRENLMFYGQNEHYERCNLPFFGFVRAFIRNRVPFHPVNSAHLAKEAERLDVIILPDIAPLSDAQIADIIALVKAGKSIVMTGASGMLDELGYMRDSFPLDELLGIRRLSPEIFKLIMPATISFKSLGEFNIHNYMRLPAPDERHDIVKGFDDTDIIGFYGQYHDVRSDRLATVAHYVPSFPVYPPEFAYMPDDKKTSDIPVILAGETGFGGRVVYFAGDLDRRHCDTGLPDQGKILANAVKWAAGGKAPCTVEGPGRLDCRLYRQADAYVMHLVNQSGLNEWPAPVEEYYPVGPIKVTVDVGGRKITKVTRKVSGGGVDFKQNGGRVEFILDKIASHEMAVLE